MCSVFVLCFSHGLVAFVCRAILSHSLSLSWGGGFLSFCFSCGEPFFCLLLLVRQKHGPCAKWQERGGQVPSFRRHLLVHYLVCWLKLFCSLCSLYFTPSGETSCQGETAAARPAGVRTGVQRRFVLGDWLVRRVSPCLATIWCRQRRSDKDARTNATTAWSSGRKRCLARLGHLHFHHIEKGHRNSKRS